MKITSVSSGDCPRRIAVSFDKPLNIVGAARYIMELYNIMQLYQTVSKDNLITLFNRPDCKSETIETMKRVDLQKGGITLFMVISVEEISSDFFIIRNSEINCKKEDDLLLEELKRVMKIQSERK